MAIKNYKTGEVTYVGRVISVTRDCERVMSDIYADVTRAKVIREDGSLESVAISYGFELCSLTLHAEADASAYWLALHNAWSEIKVRNNELEYIPSRMAMEIHDTRRETKDGVGAIRKGDRLVVTRKGKGNANGDEGVVFWVGHDRFSGSLRYGFKTDSGETRWISAGSARNASIGAEALKSAMDSSEKVVRDKFAVRKEQLVKELEIANEVYEFHRNELREFLAIAA